MTKNNSSLKFVLGTVLAAAMCIPAVHTAEESGENDNGMAAKVLSVVDPNATQAPVVTAGEKFKIMLSITTGSAPYTVMKNGRKLGETVARTISVVHRASNEDGEHKVHIQIIDADGNKQDLYQSYIIGEQEMMTLLTDNDEDEEGDDSGDLASMMGDDDDDDWGDEDEDDEDVVDPYKAAGKKVYPWTEYQSRTIMNQFLPSAVAIGDGKWYYRILHTARERIDDEPLTNFIGLDDNVKIGFQVTYGFSKNLDLN
ncbi:MAG: hypothetical protein HRU15_04120, partial [Planctomycetes bacterium]|nr:hypothetical protein [Planctomycetota bacterium]